ENLRKLSLILKGMVRLQNEGKLDQEKIEQYKRSLQTAKTLKDNLESNEKRLEEIKKIIESSENDGFILAKECVYPGVSITIHKRRFFPDRAMVKVMFMRVEDKIVLKGYSKD
ncbi:MAG TPA: FapA family protein, partial [Petrotogaceae bacterium]|nr:FapA family protein [Petrotogaceae bacterium]